MESKTGSSDLRESVLEQITTDCEHLFGERGNLTRSLVEKLREAWIQHSPKAAVRRFPQWKGTVNHAAKAIAHHYIGVGTFEEAAEYLSQKSFAFKLWTAEVYEGFQRLAEMPGEVFESAEYGQVIGMIDLIKEAQNRGEFDDQSQGAADAAMFYSNLAWFHFLWRRLFDTTDQEMQQRILAPIGNMHAALRGGRNHRTIYPHAFQYPDARDMLLLIEWLARNHFTSFDNYWLDWPCEDGPFHHSLGLDRWVYQQWVDLAFDEIPDELMLKTLRQYQSGPILHLAMNHARISILCQRLGHNDEAQRELEKARALFALCDEVSIKDRVRTHCWFARADVTGNDFEQALEIAATAPEEGQKSVRHWGPLVVAAFETNRWLELKARLNDLDVARELARDMRPYFFNLAIPKSVWTTRTEIVDSRQQQWREFLEPHCSTPTAAEGIRLQFEQLLEKDDWRAASEICLDAAGPFMGPKAIVECCVRTDGLQCALDWAEKIEDFKERQLAKIAAVRFGLDELKPAYLNVEFLSFGTLNWPAYGC